MAVNLSELLALPPEERIRLAEALLESVARAESEPLARAFRENMERTNHTLDAMLVRLEHLKETIERDRIEVREAVRRSGEEWPFPLPSPPRSSRQLSAD